MATTKYEPVTRENVKQQIASRAGCLTIRRSQQTGHFVGVYHPAAEAGFDAAGGDWVTVCEDHGTICNHKTRKAAIEHLAGADWCEACQQEQQDQPEEAEEDYDPEADEANSDYEGPTEEDWQRGEEEHGSAMETAWTGVPDWQEAAEVQQDPDEDASLFIQESERELAAMDEPERSLEASHDDNPTPDMAEEPATVQRPLSGAETHSEDESDEAVIAAIMFQLGITEPITPSQRHVLIPLADLDIPHAEQLVKQHTHAMARSLKLVAMMSPLAVTPLDGQPGKYRIAAGRRRAEGAAEAGYTLVECNIYEHLTEAQEAVLTLVEHNRHDAWMRDLEKVYELVQKKARFTAKQVAFLLGVSKSVAEAFIQIALLPEPLVEQVLAGSITKPMAKQLTRLSTSILDKLAEKAAGGDKITAADISDLLKATRSAGLAELPLSVPEEPQEVAGTSGEEDDTPRDLRGLLIALTRTGSSRARLLATALLEELGL